MTSPALTNIELVKLHRATFKSTIKEAVDAVRNDGWTPEADVGYTITDLDEAIFAITGARFQGSGHNRPLTLQSAAAAAFVDQLPESKHTRVVREALRDLKTKGHFDPKDGVWPA